MIMWTKLLLAVLFLTGCSGWTINGIPAERFRNAEPKEYAQLAAGAATSIGVHWLSHVVYFEANGIEWEQNGLREVVKQDLGGERKRWSGRIGFLGQLAGGAALKYSPWSDTWFATGYHIGTLAEIVSHPLLWGWDNSDLGYIGDSAKIEWIAYTAASIWLLEPRKN